MGYTVVRPWGYNRYGEDRFNKFLKTVPEKLRRRIYEAQPKDWYPAKDAYTLLDLIRAEFGQEGFEDYVHYLFTESVSGFMRGLASFINPESLSKRTNAMWLRIHSHGRVEPVITGKNSVQYTLYDWEAGRVSCELFEIWLCELLLMSRAKSVEIQKTHCVHDGHPFCRWDVRFTT